MNFYQRHNAPERKQGCFFLLPFLYLTRPFVNHAFSTFASAV